MLHCRDSVEACNIHQQNREPGCRRLNNVDSRSGVTTCNHHHTIIVLPLQLSAIITIPSFMS